MCWGHHWARRASEVLAAAIPSWNWTWHRSLSHRHLLTAQLRANNVSRRGDYAQMFWPRPHVSFFKFGRNLPSLKNEILAERTLKWKLGLLPKYKGMNERIKQFMPQVKNWFMIELNQLGYNQKTLYISPSTTYKHSAVSSLPTSREHLGQISICPVAISMTL